MINMTDSEARLLVPPRLKKLREKITSHKKPAVILEDIEQSNFTAFGGIPENTDSFEWPELNGQRLQFLGGFSLSAVTNIYQFDWLPTDGQLLFFYDTENQPWGFDPIDKHSHRVIFLSDPIAIIPADSADFSHSPLSPEKIYSFPTPVRFEGPLDDLTGDEIDTFTEEIELILPETNSLYHPQIGGFPEAYQNDEMELQAQLTSNGIYCGGSEHRSNPKAEKLKDGADDWKLLLQIHYDDDIGFEWGDTGTIFFWVKGSEAINNNFDNTWLILQCS